MIARAVELGAARQRPAQDQFYGDRDGYIIDPFGHGWTVASHVEDVTPDELTQRMAELYGQGGREAPDEVRAAVRRAGGVRP